MTKQLSRKVLMVSHLAEVGQEKPLMEKYVFYFYYCYDIDIDLW